MSPPTSIDGTDITGATIDGEEVQEITVDGDTVFTASSGSVILPESGDMQFFSGDTADMSILDTTQDPAINDGPYRNLALMENNDGDSMRRGKSIISTSGLNKYPVAGQTLTWIQSEPDYNKDNGRPMATFFGVQNSSNYYWVGIDPRDSFYLVKDGSIQQESFPVIDPGFWYEIEVVWGTGGSIVARLFDIDQSNGSRISELSEISFTDTEYTSGGIGVGNKGPTGGGYALQEFRVD